MLIINNNNLLYTHNNDCQFGRYNKLLQFALVNNKLLIKFQRLSNYILKYDFNITQIMISFKSSQMSAQFLIIILKYTKLFSLDVISVLII